MSKIDTFRDLIIWQKSLAFVTGIYEKTRSFPQNEQFELTSQVRRAAVSVPQ